jgi:type IV secretion system protein VirD4
VRGGLQESRKVHFILDEAASLGHLEAVDDAVDKYRGYGIRLQFYFQSLGQLRRCFPEGQEQTLLSNTSQVFFGVNDNGTADYVSARLGEETIIVDSGGSSRGMSRQVSFSNPHESSGRSDNANSNWQQQARKLLKPEEVIALPPRVAITFTSGVPPIRTTLLRYYEENIRPGWVRRVVAACVALAMAVGFCVLSMSLAALMTLAMNQ